MTHDECIHRAHKILKDARLEDTELSKSNFLDFADLVKDVIAEWSNSKRGHIKWLKDFLETLKELRDDFEALVQADPMIIYKPAHQVALEFHKSLAKYRYYRGGNGISKTQSAVADNCWIVTRRHPYRPLPPVGGSIFIVGVNFSKYAPAVFEAKYILGENGNPLSPVFPENGKWLHHYDDRKHIITVACVECANAGKARQCPHPNKPVMRLFSDVEGPTVLQGARYAQGQFDEQISYPFWSEAVKRIENVPNSGLVVTETPIYGKAFWTHQVLTAVAEGPKELNIYPGSDRPLVTLHTISQWNAGLVPHEEIQASAALMTEPERLARIEGLPVAANEDAIFDLVTLSQMREECRAPMRASLFVEVGEGAQAITEDDYDPERTASALLGKIIPGLNAIKLNPNEDGMLYLWEKPDPREQYIIGADVSKGLTKRDFSSADVFKLVSVNMDLHLEQVAQFHGWINSSFYGEELMKLALWYNEAIVGIERTGPGDATIQKMKELGYWNIFQDVNDISAARENFDVLYGIDTNQASKPVIVSLLQSVIKNKKTGKRTIILRSERSIEECENFVQAPSASGKTFSFAAIGTMHDDRVMSAGIGVYMAKTALGIYDWDRARKARMQKTIDDRDEHTRKFWESIHKLQAKKKRRRA